MVALVLAMHNDRNDTRWDELVWSIPTTKSKSSNVGKAVTEPLLNIRDLCISFASELVVDKLHLWVEQGSTTAIVGESGSGKSLTALSIMGLLPTKATVLGKIYFQSTELLTASNREMQTIRGKKIAMIFQEPMTSLNPVFTIGEQIEEGISFHQRLSKKNTRARTINILKEVGIDPIRRCAYPHEFSGGMRQRVMIAMALINEPVLLIADEPTTALDATTSKQIIKLLVEAKNRRKMSMLFISHDLKLVTSVSDYVCVMRGGRLVESGKTREVLHSPSSPYTRALLACQPSLTKRTARLQTVPEHI
jgi:ABC-type dipeptide/oligopeptide/nickel transport system ATPase component